MARGHACASTYLVNIIFINAPATIIEVAYLASVCIFPIAVTFVPTATAHTIKFFATYAAIGHTIDEHYVRTTFCIYLSQLHDLHSRTS